MDLPDCSERTVLLTGGTRGIGRYAARKLCSAGATLLLVGRDAERGTATVERMCQAGADAEFLQYDLASQAAVRELAADVRGRVDRLDALVNNAGLARANRSKTPENVPTTVAVNHLAPYLLTHELMPLLADSAPSRVVVTASDAHRRATLDRTDLDLTGPYDGFEAYARTKLMNVLFVYELADRLRGTDVTAAALHPGFIPSSSLYRDSAVWLRAAMRLLSILPIGRSIEDGGLALAHLACSDDTGDGRSRYFDGIDPADPAPEAEDADLRRALWDRSAELVGVDPAWPTVRREV